MVEKCKECGKSDCKIVIRKYRRKIRPNQKFISVEVHERSCHRKNKKKD